MKSFGSLFIIKYCEDYFNNFVGNSEACLFNYT